MKTSKGTTRRVFIFKNIVIKVAVIQWNNLFKGIISTIIYEITAIRRDGIEYFNFKNKSEYKRIKKLENEKELNEYLIEATKLFHIQMLAPKSYEKRLTVANCLFAGIMANYNEYIYYMATENPFCEATYFSFFGLFNIQKIGDNKVPSFLSEKILDFIANNSQHPNQVKCDGHTLTSIENFCMDLEDRHLHLKIFDYGSRQVQLFLELNGDNLYKKFKLFELLD